MIFADKLIRLRKKNGWSQEELADKMNVSRQAVSKWEGAQTVPDLTKMLQLAELFGVTTDYLLKDDIESEEFTGDGEEAGLRRVTLAEANEYLNGREVMSKRIAIATFMCIIAVIPLLILGAATEIPSFGISEKVASCIGLITLFIVIAAAVGIFVYCGFKNSPYEFLDKEQFDTEYGVRGMVRDKMKAFHPTYVKSNIIGTCLCVLSPVPLFIGAFTENGFFTVIMLSVTMFTAGIGVIFFITAGVKYAAMQRLVEEGEFSKAEKKKSAVMNTIAGIYWMSATAIYLAISFMWNNWDTSWIVWPIAAVLYAAVASICSLIIKKGDK